MHEAERVLRSVVCEAFDLAEHPGARRLEVVGVASELVERALAALPLPRAPGVGVQERPALDVLTAELVCHLERAVRPIEESRRQQVGIDRTGYVLEESRRLQQLVAGAFHVELSVEEGDAEKDLRARGGLAARLREGLLGETSRLCLTAVVVPDDRAQARCLRPRRAGPCALERPAEDRVCVVRVREVAVRAFRRGDPPLDCAPGLGRLQARALVEGDRVERRATLTRAVRRPLERGRDDLVRLGHHLSELTRANVLGVRGLGESGPDAPQRFLVRGRERGLREQRVAEPNLALRHLHDRVGDRGAESSRGVRDSGVSKHLQRGLGRRCGVEQCRPRPRREAADPVGGEGSERVRQRKRRSRVERRARASERLRYLERVERVASRCAPDLEQDQARERAAETRDEQAMEGRQRQRAELETLERARRESSRETQWIRAPSRLAPRAARRPGSRAGAVRRTRGRPPCSRRATARRRSRSGAGSPL